MRKSFNNSSFKIALMTVLPFALIFVLFFGSTANAGFFGDFTFAVKQFKKEAVGEIAIAKKTIIAKEVGFSFFSALNGTVSEVSGNLTASVISSFVKTVNKFSQWNDAVESKLGNTYLKTISYIIPGYTVEILNQQPIQAYRLPEARETIIKEIVRETIIQTPPTEKIIKQEVEKITETEHITEVTKVTETIKEADLTEINDRITGIESQSAQLASMLNAIRTTDNYVSTPRVFNETGDLIFRAHGGGSIFISADNGLQLSGGQIILDAKGDTNITPYITVKDILNIDNANIQQTGSTLTNTFEGALTVSGSTTLSGNATIGDESTDTLTVTSQISSDLIPSADSTYNLGSADNQWSSLYVSGSTIYLGGTAISNDSGVLTWAGSGGIQSATGTTTLDILNLTNQLAVAYGGTNATNITDARTNLGLAIGTDVQAYDADLTTYAGITPSANIQTFLGSADYATARTNLGLAIGTDVQAYDATLQSLSGLASAADLLPYFTGSGTAATTSLTSFARTLLDDANNTTARTTLGLAIGTDVQAYDAYLADISGITANQGDIIYFDGANWTDLAPGLSGKFLKTQGTGANPIWDSVGGGGDMLGSNNLSELTSTSTARTNLGLAIGTDVQAYDADLTTYAGITPSANIQTFLGSADYATARTNLGLAIGTDVQAYDATLQSLSGLASAADLLPYFTGSGTAATTSLTSFARTLLDDANNTTARTTLGLAIGTDVQSYSSLLADIAALATTDSNFIVANGSTWVAETGATARTSLGIGAGDSPTLTGLTLSGLTNGSLLFATSSGIISQSNSNLFWDNVNSRLGIGTSTPARKLSVVDAASPQLRLTSDVSTIYTDFSVAASTGDLTVSLYPSSSANDIILNMPSGSTGANLWICEGDACPTASFTGGGNLFVEGDIKYATSSRKTYRSIILTAAGAITPTTGGAAKTQVDGNHSYYVLDFDATADEAAYWQWTMPDSYDDGVINVTYYWAAGATSGDTIWCFQAKGISANSVEDINATLDAAICEPDTAQGNANDLASIAESNATSSFTAGEYTIFKVFRDADAGGDTMSGDARLVKVKIEYGVSQESD